MDIYSQIHLYMWAPMVVCMCSYPEKFEQMNKILYVTIQ